VRDRAAARADVARLCDEELDRVVVTPGDVLATGGRVALRASVAWLLEPADAPASKRAPT
jgi:hypothetical protein